MSYVMNEECVWVYIVFYVMNELCVRFARRQKYGNEVHPLQFLNNNMYAGV